MTVFFTSDTHFLHKKVSALRGFDTPAEHDAELIRKWNSVVRHDDDIVWLLGDVGIPTKGATDKDVLDLVRQLNGRKQLVTGNHDSVWPANRNARNNQAKWMHKYEFESVQPFAKTSVCGTDFLLSHFPYEGDTERHDEDRATQFRLRNQQFPLLHGHIHSKEKVTSQRNGSDLTGWQIHVGMDAWDMYPVKDTQIKELWVVTAPRLVDNRGLH